MDIEHVQLDRETLVSKTFQVVSILDYDRYAQQCSVLEPVVVFQPGGFAYDANSQTWYLFIGPRQDEKLFYLARSVGCDRDDLYPFVLAGSAWYLLVQAHTLPPAKVQSLAEAAMVGLYCGLKRDEQAPALTDDEIGVARMVLEAYTEELKTDRQVEQYWQMFDCFTTMLIDWNKPGALADPPYMALD